MRSQRGSAHRRGCLRSGRAVAAMLLAAVSGELADLRRRGRRRGRYTPPRQLRHQRRPGCSGRHDIPPDLRRRLRREGSDGDHTVDGQRVSQQVRQGWDTYFDSSDGRAELHIRLIEFVTPDRVRHRSARNQGLATNPVTSSGLRPIVALDGVTPAPR